MPWALDFAPDKAGSSMEASTAMIAITTSNSISVNPTIRARFLGNLGNFEEHRTHGCYSAVVCSSSNSLVMNG